MQTFLSLAKRSHRADCHILALDEFWLRQLLEEDLLEDITQYVGDMGKRDAYVTGAHDLALLQRGTRDNQGKDLERWFAVPTRNNVGVLCYDPDLLEGLLELCDPKDPLVTRVQDWIKQEPSSFGSG
ncbi:MAG TPA: hypothetical protein VJN18_20725 [Polyangiaceae bacterium]|nr:hypothetical protein [Polyangiaceae bacterium]